MAKASLFKTSETLLQGYCDLRRDFHLDNNLTKGKGGRKVYLLGRVLNSGNISLMRYSCHDGKREREMLGCVLKIESDWNIKRENEEKLRLQVIKCNELNSDLERTEQAFIPMAKSKAYLIDYILKIGDDALQETGNRHSMYAVMWSLAKHVELYAGRNVMFKDVDEDWIRGFIEYCKHDALNLNYTRTSKDGKRKEVKISQNTQHKLITKLNLVLKKASRGKNRLIASNPMDGIESDEKVKSKQGTREFLSEEEVSKLMETPFNHGKYDIKEAFLFSCFTGLRYSDLCQLKMSDFRMDRNGRYIKIQMVKTREPLKIYIPDVAFNLIPDVEDDTKVFSLPKNDYANECLRKWCKDSGIKKFVTFHCARHSAATILYSNGVPIQTIQKQLGHLKSATTELYAKMMDSAQSEASKMFDTRFGSDGKKK